jgi:hypothetical protein
LLALDLGTGADEGSDGGDYFVSATLRTEEPLPGLEVASSEHQISRPLPGGPKWFAHMGFDILASVAQTSGDSRSRGTLS